MTVALVQISPVASWTGANTCTPTLSAGATANNLIVLPWSHEQFDGNSVAQSSPGFSVATIINQSGDVTATGCLYKVAVGGETSAVITNTTAGSSTQSFGAANAVEFTGLDPNIPFVAADSNTAVQNAGTTLVVSSGNPLSESAGVAIATFSCPGSMAGGTAPPSGWTAINSDLAGGNVTAYLIFASTAQLSASIGTITTANQMAASISIFKIPTRSAGRTQQMMMGMG